MLAGVLGAVGLLLWKMRRPDDSASVVGLVLVVLAAIAAVFVTALAAAPARESVASWDGGVVDVTGDVTSSASVGRDGRLWMELQLTGIGSPGNVAPASAPVRIGIESADGFDLGSQVRVTGEASATDPGERSALVVYTSAAAVEAPASGVFAVAAHLRAGFVERSSMLPEPGAGLLPGLAVGDTRAVSIELNDEMRTSGLSHLTAVSGDTVGHWGGSLAVGDNPTGIRTTSTQLSRGTLEPLGKQQGTKFTASAWAVCSYRFALSAESRKEAATISSCC